MECWWCFWLYWYTYALNNPLIYTDPDGEFIWIIPNISWSKEGGLSLGLSVVFGIPGLLSAQAGGGYNFKSGDPYAYAGVSAAFNTLSTSYSPSGGWNAGYAVGATPFSGLPISSNFATVGVNYNITNDSWSGNLSAWTVDQNGWTFNPSVSAMLFPEQTTNFVRGQGFRSNEQVFNRFTASQEYQNALDYFSFKGKYDPEHYYFYDNDHPARTDEYTGNIYYNETAVDGGFDKLYATWDHEMSHRADALAGRINFDNGESYYQSAYESEVRAYSKNIRNEGLYRQNGYSNWISNLNIFGMKAQMPMYLNATWTPNRVQSFFYKLYRLW